MVDGSTDLVRLAAARADFLASPDAQVSGVPDLLVASWRRSRSAGVEFGRYTVEYHQDLDFDTRLSRCARPVLQRLAGDMNDVPVSIALADAKARIIDRRDCSTSVGRVLDGVDFNPGFSFAEQGIGTNGIGTVYEAGRPVSVVGSAHFNETLTPFACAGAPILDPLTGRLEGVLDVSLLATNWNPLILALVKTAAGDIGRNLMLDRSRAQQALFETYVKVDARTHHAVVAVGDTVILNQRAQHLLSPEDQLVVQQHARFLMSRHADGSDLLRLTDGRSVQLRVTRVVAGGDTTGVVLLISDPPPVAGEQVREWSHTARAGFGAFIANLPKQPEPEADQPWAPHSGCAAWERAARTVWEALRDGTPVLLSGGPGSGRLHLLRELFARTEPEGRVVTIGGDLPVHMSTETACRTLIVLRELDTYDAQQAAAVDALLAGLDGPWLLAGTLRRPVSDSHPAAGLMARFSSSVTVPDLRHRATDVPQLATELIHELAPGRRVRLSPAAERVLAAHPWPGNVTQLRDTLAAALARRPVGEIQVEDLPGHCRTTSPRALTALEVAERDAIVAALTAHAGNRVHAAKALGMARSSLYRKLKYYSISEV